MRKLFIILVVMSMFMACEEEEIEQINTVVAENYVTYIPVDPETEEPLVLASCDVTPIDENVLFYFFTDSKSLWKITSTYDSESIKIDAVMQFENSEDQIVQFLPYEFFARDGYFYYSWMIKDYTFDNEGNLIERIIKYYRQKDNIIEEIDEYVFHRVPYIYYSTDYLSEKFSTGIFSYEDEVWNRLDNLQESSYRVFKQISRNVFEITNAEGLENGIFFNVIESRMPGLQEGLYFFPVDRTSVNRVKEKGRLWIQGLIWEWN